MISAFSSLCRSFSIAGFSAYGTDLGLRNFGVASGFIFKVACNPFNESVCALKMFWYFAMTSSTPKSMWQIYDQFSRMCLSQPLPAKTTTGREAVC